MDGKIGIESTERQERISEARCIRESWGILSDLMDSGVMIPYVGSNIPVLSPMGGEGAHVSIRAHLCHRSWLYNRQWPGYRSKGSSNIN